MSKKTLKILVIILLLVVTAAVLVVVHSLSGDPIHMQEVSLNEFRDGILSKAFSTVKIYGNQAEGVVSPFFLPHASDEPVVKMTLLPTNMENWINLLLQKGIPVTLHFADKTGVISFLTNILTSLFSFIAYVFFIRFLLGSSMLTQKYQFIKTGISFKDVAGMETIKSEVREMVDFLKNKDKYATLNCRTPKGLLISGPPGNGKTLLAKAIAGESGVTFVAASASSFIELYVGTGPKAIRELFEAARKNTPCVIFIDELDSLGSRATAWGGGGSETTKTINQFLAEMDGVVSNEGILVVGATNSPELIDPAARRSGRFDRHVVVSNPDYKERLLVLKLYLNIIPLDHSVNIDKIARNTAGFSRADLENLTNEAKIVAIRNGSKFVNVDHIKEAFDKILFGLPGEKLDQKDSRLTAYHEAGHAFLFFIHHKILGKIYKATIIPHGMALGFVMPENNDAKAKTKAWREANIQVCFAGRIAEEMFFGKEHITNGCSEDLDHARKEAETYVLFGMSEVYGLATITKNKQLSSEKEKELVREWVTRLMSEMEQKTRAVMEEGRIHIERLAERLLIEETLTGEQIIDIIENKKLLPVVRKVLPGVNLK